MKTPELIEALKARCDKLEQANKARDYADYLIGDSAKDLRALIAHLKEEAELPGVAYWSPEQIENAGFIVRRALKEPCDCGHDIEFHKVTVVGGCLSCDCKGFGVPGWREATLRGKP